MALDKALEGIRVLDLSRLLPGPFLTMILGDLGADVVKVEDPRVGDYMRNMPPAQKGVGSRYLAVNRNKRSLCLDLKTDTGRSAFLRMVKKADVVVESFRPGVMDRLGVGYPVLKEYNSKIILCSVSGYGQTGPYQKRAGHDLNYIGLAGVLAMGGEARGRKPGMPGVQIADVAGGGMWGLSGVLAALVKRERRGEGEHLDISMTEGSLSMLAAEIGNFDSVEEVPTRGEATLNGGLACYSVYETKDGRYFSVGALEPKFWTAFNIAVGREPNVAELIGLPEQQEELRAKLQEIFKTKTRDEWSEIFAATDSCCEPVLEMDELKDHPLHKERGVFFEIADPEIGTSTQIRTPLGVREQSSFPPLLGQHSKEVLSEYDFSEDEIASLFS